jgi:DNA mismatch endonuclease (patch repair protein)
MSRDPAVTSRIMAAVHNRDTKPEILLRHALWRRGLRYRVRTAVHGKPDIVFPRARVAVFVDGDFWHGNAWRIRGLPTFESQFERIKNSQFWREKITANMARDAEVTASLTAEDWRVYRVFESRLADDLAGAVSEIEALVRQRQPTKSSGSGTTTADSTGGARGALA